MFHLAVALMSLFGALGSMATLVLFLFRGVIGFFALPKTILLSLGGGVVSGQGLVLAASAPLAFGASPAAPSLFP
jgi:hypothetical protein